MRPGNYAEQASTYDRTRAASPVVVGAIADALGPADGRTLLDIAGGTGNFAQALSERGFRVTVADAVPAMLARTVTKLGPGRAVAADAGSLPFRDGSFDGAMIVTAIHLFPDIAAALAEARRVIRGGPLVVVAYTRENLEALFAQEYFGGWHGTEVRETRDGIERALRAAGFARVDVTTYVYPDAASGSLVAMHTDASALADEARLRNTSFWHRFPEAERRRGLEALRADLASGVLAERVRASIRRAELTGHGTLFAARP